MKNIVFSDVDAIALDELVSRRYKMVLPNGENIMKTHIVYGSITEDPVQEKIKKYTGLGTVDFLACNFAIHYFMSHLRQFAMLCQELMKVGGLVMLIYVDGKQVHQMFTDNGIKHEESISMSEDDRPKYTITRLYHDNVLRD